MQSKTNLKVDQDYRIFFAFMTLVLIGISILSFIQNPALHQPAIAILFVLLMLIHIALHWLVIPIVQTPRRKAFYIIGQGLLAFVLTSIAQNTSIAFGLYMALIGETIGFLGINRWSSLSTIYFLALALTNFIIFTNIQNAVYLLVNIIPIIIFIGMYVTMYLRQAEARERAQALASELETANKQLTEYSARVEDLTIVNERQRMARELHDTLSQGLAGVILQLEAADAHLANDRAGKAQSIIGNAMEQARFTLSEARRAIDDLRQPSVDDLDSALRLEISRFMDATGIPLRFQADPIPSVPDPVKETLVRAVAEGLTNIAHHAHAHNVEVKVRRKDKNLMVSVKDDGVGFEPSVIPSGHYGILGIQERVRLINGSFAIQSEKSKGTILQIEIPL